MITDLKIWAARKRKNSELLFEDFKLFSLLDVIDHWKRYVRGNSWRDNKVYMRLLITLDIINIRDKQGDLLTVEDFSKRQPSLIIEKIKDAPNTSCSSKKELYLAYFRFIEYLSSLTDGLFESEKRFNFTCDKSCCKWNPRTILL